MPTKRFTVKFYSGELINPNAEDAADEGDQTKSPPPFSSVAEIFLKISQADHLVRWKTGDGELYFLKDIQVSNQDRNFRAVFGKLRMSDLPHIADADGNEQEIDLKPVEGLIEKNYLIYQGERKLLIYQENFYASHVARFSQYLSRAAGMTVEFSPIIKPDTMKRFMKGEVQLRKFDVRVSRPTNASMFPSDNFSSGMLQMLTSSHGATLGVHMSANLPGTRGGFFPARVKQWIAKMITGNYANRAVVEVAEGAHTFEIDLLKDQILAKRDMAMEGRYPNPKSVFAEMDHARRDVETDLKEHFGALD